MEAERKMKEDEARINLDKAGFNDPNIFEH